MAKKEKPSVEFDHSEEAFYSNGLTISHTPGIFVFDFIQTIPRFNAVSGKRRQTMVIKHKTIVVDPMMAKRILEVLKENISKYEKSFGKIVSKKIKSKEAESTRYIG